MLNPLGIEFTGHIFHSVKLPIIGKSGKFRHEGNYYVRPNKEYFKVKFHRKTHCTEYVLQTNLPRIQMVLYTDGNNILHTLQ